MAARWTQQQQQPQQRWRQPGQLGMALGGGGGLDTASGGGGVFSRSPSGPMDARWSNGDSPPGLALLRSREDHGGEGAGGLDQWWPLGGEGEGGVGLGLHSSHQSPAPSPRQRDPRSPEDGGVEGVWGRDQPWALGGGGGGVGGHGSPQPLSPSSRLRVSDSRQWGGGGGESPTDWGGQAPRAGWGGESGPPWPAGNKSWPAGNKPSSPSQGCGGRGGSEKKSFYVIFAAANPALNDRIFYDTFSEVNRYAINGMPALSGAASFFVGAKSEEEARRVLREKGCLGDGPVEAVEGRQPVARSCRRHY